MAYETGSSTDLADLLDKLSTFAQANGWTEDEIDDGVSVAGEGRLALSKTTGGSACYISFKYDSASPDNLSIHQALAYDGFGTDPGEHTDDSGNGYNGTSPYLNANLDNERCVNVIGDGPFPSYHFFEEDDGTIFYIHVVVESEVDVYRHFGFGFLDQVTDWTGGEYCYGHYHATGGSSSGVLTGNTVLLDGLFSTTNALALRAATIHAEDLPGQGANEKWLQVVGHASFANEANWRDTAGEIKRLCFGGFRGGLYALHLGNFEVDPTTGFLGLYKIGVLYYDNTNSHLYHLGELPDVRGVHMRNLSDGQEVTVGSDTWVVFSSGRKTEAVVDLRVYYQGIAYKKVTA